ncbi:hypothetical protein [Pseudoalteromonas sp. NBT06-2]|uniref:hypothetical protein n=1 Tax=Pseudoalteromonas sp. NBT06-2 TaxID=2025950 RepID=UPI0014834BDB|nr:hypothetical protein [Pseudoalteromonas sp. NBT06-2]
MAATSATYGWLFPFGTIAAGITAGIYGAKATKAKKAIEGATSLITTKNQKEQADMAMMNDLNLVCSNIQKAVEHQIR